MTMAHSDHSDLLPVGYQLEEFRIDGLLGQGGFSKVYRATDTVLTRPVAIKEYLPGQLAVRDTGQVRPRSADDEEDFQWGLRRFLSEARLLAQVDHPNVVRILRILEANDTAYFVMPCEPGMSLEDVLLRHGPLRESSLLRIILPLLDALALLHRAGIYHRDIKPQNIILRQGGHPLLIDFGAARTALGHHTRTLQVVTRGYSPIEQYTDDMPAGPYTDIYAFAALCYRAISGEKPLEATRRSLQQGTPDPLVSARQRGAGRYSPSLLAAIDRALAVLPEDRPGSVEAWLALFPRQCRSRLTPTGGSAGRRQPLPPPTDADPGPSPARNAPAAAAPRGFAMHWRHLLSALHGYRRWLAVAALVLAAMLVLLWWSTDAAREALAWTASPKAPREAFCQTPGSPS